MATKKELICGFWVVFDEAALIDGVKYLRYDLQPSEARTLFDAARLRGSAEFEDDQDRDWTITYNRGDNTYTLFRRQRE